MIVADVSHRELPLESLDSGDVSVREFRLTWFLAELSQIEIF